MNTSLDSAYLKTSNTLAQQENKSKLDDSPVTQSVDPVISALSRENLQSPVEKKPLSKTGSQEFNSYSLSSLSRTTRATNYVLNPKKTSDQARDPDQEGSLKRVETKTAGEMSFERSANLRDYAVHQPLQSQYSAQRSAFTSGSKQTDLSIPRIPSGQLTPKDESTGHNSGSRCPPSPSGANTPASNQQVAPKILQPSKETDSSLKKRSAWSRP